MDHAAVIVEYVLSRLSGRAGPCQFPTLGFVVDRYIEVMSFVPEPFWYIDVMHKRDDKEVHFKWSKNHLFDEEAVRAIYERCRDDPQARVTKVFSRQTKKFKCTPLTTVDLQKSASRLLHLSPKRILDIAESLYQKGLLSYPRTETDQYDKAFDFKALIEKQKADGAWGTFATRLNDGGEFERPRDGRKNDKAHPPIHPTMHANNLSGDDKRVYDYVVRRFLGSCHKDAVGLQTTVDIEISKEAFKATGKLEKLYAPCHDYMLTSDARRPRHSGSQLPRGLHIRHLERHAASYVHRRRDFRTNGNDDEGWRDDGAKAAHGGRSRLADGSQRHWH